jgi:lysophospholipid acyltransferase (LPLAT)-like uncharacterized protein
VKKILRSAPAQHAIAWALTLYVRLVMASQSWRVEGKENLRLLAGDDTFIIVFWHETLPAISVLLRQARAAGVTKQGVVLASRHRDGQLIGNVMVNLGMEQVAGSTNKGGASGLRGLLRALSAGKHVCITPDGPRGPRRVAAPGVGQLAALSGARVIPCGVCTTRAVTLDTWDQMRLALPFGRGVLAIGAPIAVARDNWEPGLADINAALNAIQEAAQEATQKAISP